MLKRKMRAFACLVIVFVMALSMTSAAFADENEIEITAPLEANSFRYENGEPIRYDEQGDVFQSAWQKVNGFYLNDKGNAITGALARGIDVSAWQGDINWDKVIADGVEFAIIRCGSTYKGEQTEDSKWEVNASACQAKGLPFGTYYYSMAQNADDAKKEAEFVLERIKDYTLSLPVYYDLEDHSMPKEELLNIAKAFCGTLQKAGVEVAIYANSDWYNTYLTNSYFDGIPKWLAQWNSTVNFSRSYTMWQCTDKGRVDGIEGYVDIDFKVLGMSEDLAAAFLERLYRIVLGRKPDIMGLDTWLEQLADGSSNAAEIIWGFYNSQEYLNKKTSNEDFVESLYSVCMNRKSDKAGKASWVSLLKDVHVSRTAVLAGFVGSQEFMNVCTAYGIKKGNITITEPRDKNYNVTKLVNRFYNVFLDRNADISGLNYWCDKLNNGTMAKEIAYGFVFSPEFQGKNFTTGEYIRYMYVGILGREPEKAGFDYWVEKIDSGAYSRNDIFNGFCDSDEFKKLVAGYGVR